MLLSAYAQKQLDGVRRALYRRANDIVGFRSKEAIDLYFRLEHRVAPKPLPHRGREKAFVFETEGDIELWIDVKEGKSVWTRSFRNYLRLYHGIETASLSAEGFSVDHSYPRYMAKCERLHLSRLFLVKRTVNSSWGNWEEHFTQNDAREDRLFAHMTFSQMLKLSGFHGPRFPVSDDYVEAAAKHLVDLDLITAGKDHLLAGLRHYLTRGDYVPPLTRHGVQ